jgi:hypothetical protein
MRDVVLATKQANANFRDIKAFVKYAASKRAGVWGPSPQSVTIDSEGHLTDGFNRMKSDLELGVTGRWYLTVRRWNSEWDHGIDRGVARNTAQWFRKHLPERKIDNGDIGCVKWAIRGGSPLNLPAYKLIEADVIVEALDVHEEAFKLVLSAGYRSGFNAPMKGAFVRAYGLVDGLEEALAMVVAGERPDGMTALRASPMTRLISLCDQSHSTGGGNTMALTQYQKAASTLVMWGQGKPMEKTYGLSKDPFKVGSLDAIWKRLLRATRQVQEEEAKAS